METCDYEPISESEKITNYNNEKGINHDSENGKYNDKNRQPFWRQIFLCSAAWNLGFCLGISAGINTVAIPQMIKENIEVSDEFRSWMGSASSFASVVWLLIFTPITHRFGVKKTYLLLYASLMVGSTTLFFSKTSSQFLVGIVLNSAMQTSMSSITIMVLTEYVSPMNRSLALFLKSASIFWGIWLANAIGTFFYWRYIPAVMMGCSLYGFTVFFWPESPFWLASKGRMDECAHSFRWARGVDLETKIELKKLIEFQSNHREREKTSLRENIKDHFNWLLSREFYKPMLLSLLLTFMYMSTGKVVCTMYAIEMLSNMTTTKWAYTSMLILDGINVIGMYCGCYFAKKSNQRHNLFKLTGVGIACLYLLSLQNFLVNFNIIDNHFIVSLALLIVYSLSICIGPLMSVPALAAELFPVKNRLFFCNYFTGLGQIAVGVFMKFAPFVLKLGLNVAFLMYAILTSVSLVLLYIFLPVTQGKTSLEIQEYFCNNKKDRTEVKIQTDLDKSLLSES